MEPDETEVAAVERDPALLEALDAAGGTAALARVLDCKTQAISQWRRVPAERCLAVEAASGVSRYRLRPDIYGDPPAAAHPAAGAVAQVVG